MVKLDKTQSSVLAFLFEQLPIGDLVNTLDFSLSGDFHGKYYAAHASLGEPTENISVVFTLPTYTTHTFFALTRSKEMEVARLLANIEDYEKEKSINLRLGEAIITPGKSSSTDSWEPHGVILLRTASAVDLRNVPDKEKINGKEIFFFLVVPLTKAEWDCRKQFGHDALIDLFQSNGKELFFC